MDKTGASYYGKTQLHYVDWEGNTAMVQLSKEGPIYSGKKSIMDAIKVGPEFLPLLDFNIIILLSEP